MENPEKKTRIGKVSQVMGPVIDVRFDDGVLPEIFNALEIKNGDKKLIAEVAQHIGDNVVRCIAMSSTDGLVRGTDAVDVGHGITVPVGRETLGRIFNVLGEPVDEKPAPENCERHEIHRQPPSYEDPIEEEKAREVPIWLCVLCFITVLTMANQIKLISYLMVYICHSVVMPFGVNLSKIN